MPLVVADILGTKDLIAVLFTGIVVLIVLFMGRRISINVRGVSASVEAAAGEAKEAAEKAAEKAEQVEKKVDAAHTDLKQTVGEVNGNGDLMQMLSRVLGLSMEVLHWQERHDELAKELLELYGYSHDEIHRINGLMSTMWALVASDHGIDPTVLPPPQPSPKEHNAPPSH